MIEFDRHFRLVVRDIFGLLGNLILLAGRFRNKCSLLFGNLNFLAFCAVFFKALGCLYTNRALIAALAIIVLVPKHAWITLSIFFELKGESPINQ